VARLKLVEPLLLGLPPQARNEMTHASLFLLLHERTRWLGSPEWNVCAMASIQGGTWAHTILCVSQTLLSAMRWLRRATIKRFRTDKFCIGC